MSNPTTEQLYLLHKKEATKAAHWAVRRYYRPLEEAQDHADFALALLLLERLDEHDPEKLPLANWLNMKIIWHLRTVYTKGKHPHVPNVRESHRRERASSHIISKWERGELPAPESTVSRPSRIQQMLQEVGEEGAALLRILRDLPGDLWAEIRPERGRTPKTKEHNLQTWLIDTQDWSQRRAAQAFQEVKKCL